MMKAFFEQCLRDLHRLTGLKQYMEICNKPTEAEAKEEMNIIVDGMVRVSEKFNYIPQDAQKRIVAHQIISDPEMYALNAKVVYKWFNAVSDKYWHESGHLETNAIREAQINNTEPISEETQVMINKFMTKLAGGAIKEIPKISPLELLNLKKEDDIRQNGQKAFAVGFHPNDNLIEISNRKMMAAKKRGLDKLDFRDLKSFEIDNQIVIARNLEEAQEIYLEIYT